MRFRFTRLVLCVRVRLGTLRIVVVWVSLGRMRVPFYAGQSNLSGRGNCIKRGTIELPRKTSTEGSFIYADLIFRYLGICLGSGNS